MSWQREEKALQECELRQQYGNSPHASSSAAPSVDKPLSPEALEVLGHLLSSAEKVAQTE
eukprot:COSAG05_NODE_20202_length_281_cov_1.796703_1_plen_59_part_01